MLLIVKIKRQVALKLQDMVSLHSLCFSVEISTQHLYQRHIFSCVLYIIALVHSIRCLWHDLAILLNEFRIKQMEIMHCQADTSSWMQKKDLLPPQYGAGRPPSFVLGCWKGHQETRVSLRREGNAKVNAHQLCEREVGCCCHASGSVLRASFWISVTPFCPITYTDHKPK